MCSVTHREQHIPEKYEVLRSIFANTSYAWFLFMLSLRIDRRTDIQPSCQGMRFIRITVTVACNATSSSSFWMGVSTMNVDIIDISSPQWHLKTPWSPFCVFERYMLLYTGYALVLFLELRTLIVLCFSYCCCCCC